MPKQLIIEIKTLLIKYGSLDELRHDKINLNEPWRQQGGSCGGTLPAAGPKYTKRDKLIRCLKGLLTGNLKDITSFEEQMHKIALDLQLDEIDPLLLET